MPSCSRRADQNEAARLRHFRIERVHGLVQIFGLDPDRREFVARHIQNKECIRLRIVSANG